MKFKSIPHGKKGHCHPTIWLCNLPPFYQALKPLIIKMIQQVPKSSHNVEKHKIILTWIFSVKSIYNELNDLRIRIYFWKVDFTKFFLRLFQVRHRRKVRKQNPQKRIFRQFSTIFEDFDILETGNIVFQ